MCKQSEIYRTMCEVYGEACFSQKYIYNIGIPQRVGVEKKVHGVNVSGATLSKECVADNLLRRERNHYY